MERLTNILTIVAIILIFAIMMLCITYIIIKQKEKKKLEEKDKDENQKEEQNYPSTKTAMQYTKKSIFDFMQFDKIEDNMIVQDNGQRYLMILECQGVNYDLMSEIEKTAVESGFVQFLNTLRYPIQLYVQTRTLNISDSMQNYRNRLDDVKKEMNRKQQEYNRMLKENNYDEVKLSSAKRELIRVRNMYEYGQDVINDIQKTSQNKNVLRRNYYLVVPYYSAELYADLLDDAERNSMIFSELYTRAETLANALLSCDVKSRILESHELVELLYVAYNRDESDTYGVEKAIKAGFNEIYSTAPDVLKKRMHELDKQIESDAMKLAQDAISEVRLEEELEIKKKEERFAEIVKQMAESLLKENEVYVGKDITEKAIDKIKGNDEGGSSDGEKAKKRTRRTTKEE